MSRHARYSAAEVAEILNTDKDLIPFLCKKGLLAPLGNPKPTATKWFAAVDIDRLAQDKEWLNRVTDAAYEEIAQHNPTRKLSEVKGRAEVDKVAKGPWPNKNPG